MSVGGGRSQNDSCAGENMDVLLARAATTPEVIDMISQNLLKLFYRERVQRQARTNNKKEGF